MNDQNFKNKVLKHLGMESIKRLELHSLPLEVMRELEFPGTVIDNLFFIEAGVGSTTVTMQDGAQVEAGMFGFESVMGLSALMGVRRSLNRAYMQIAGHGYSSAVEAARREFNRGEVFHDLALRYVQMQLTQSMQSTACNAKHDVMQRLSRWLLICAERGGADEFGISQEFLADMLGISRPSVSIAAGHLKEEGLISYSRGRIHVLDAEALERRACECYMAVKVHLDNLMEFDPGFSEGAKRRALLGLAVGSR